MQFSDMTWMDVEHYLNHHDDRVVVIVGACEQHAYLSLMTDIRAPLAIARVAAQIEPVLIAPPLNYGISPYFAAFPGTVSIRPETLATLTREVIESLLEQGFGGMLVSNGHGGNTGALRPVLIELADTHPDARLALFEWWRDARVLAVGEAAGLPSYHANWSEALPITRVGELPEGDKVPPDIPQVASPQVFRETLGDGSFGGPYRAPETVIESVFDAAVASMVEALQALKRTTDDHS